MGRKFESKLGQDVAAGKRSQSSLKLGVAAAAIASCVMLVSLAGTSMAMGRWNDNGGSPFMVEKVVFDKEVDEIAWDVHDAAAKRVMSLKYKSMNTPEGGIDVPFTKFNYVMNFAFNETVNLKDIEVGELLLTFVSDDLVGEGETLDLTGVDAKVNIVITGTDYLDGGVVAAVSYVSAQLTYSIVMNAVEVSVFIPGDLVWDPSAGDIISVTVTIEISEHVLHGSAVETPWARYDPLFADHTGTF